MNERQIRYMRDKRRREQVLAAALWSSLTAGERRLWLAYSVAVGRVPRSAG